MSEMIKTIIKVQNMKCEGCEARVVRVLEELEGVHHVEANYKEGKVTIQSDVELDRNQLKERLEELDFPVVEDASV